jgi:hypothetical protein
LAGAIQLTTARDVAIVNKRGFISTMLKFQRPRKLPLNLDPRYKGNVILASCDHAGAQSSSNPLGSAKYYQLNSFEANF